MVHDQGWRDGPENALKRETNPAAIVVVIDIAKQRLKDEEVIVDRDSRCIERRPEQLRRTLRIEKPAIKNSSKTFEKPLLEKGANQKIQCLCYI